MEINKKALIINGWAKDRTVEDIITNYDIKAPTEALEDLAQNMYMSLLEKDEELIVNLNNKNEYKKFISGMVYHHIYSNDSPWAKRLEQSKKICDIEYYENIEKYNKNSEYNDDRISIIKMIIKNDLKEKEKEVINLLMMGMQFQDVAERMGISKTQTRNYYNSATNKIKQIINMKKYDRYI